MSWPATSDIVTKPLVTFMVSCPFCREQVPLPVVTTTALLETEPGGSWLSVRVGTVPRVPHTCTGQPS